MVSTIILDIFIILITMLSSLNSSENKILDIPVHHYKYNSSIDITKSQNGSSHLCKIHISHDMSCIRPLCPVRPSQPGCPTGPRPGANVSALNKLENMTK